MPDQSTAVARVAKFNADQLRAIDPHNIAGTLASAGIPTLDAADILGTGFTVCEDKDLLINVPLLILDWHYSDGDHGRFVSILALTKTDKIVINDGGSGIMSQLASLEAEGYDGAALRVMRGLRKSEFWYDPENPGGEKFRTQEDPEYKRGVTYYLSV